VLVLPVGGAAAAAKATRAPVRAGADSGPEIFVGYSFLQAGEANLNGWELSGSFRWRRSLRLVADLSAHFGSFAGGDVRQVNLLAGARYTRPGSGRLRPFAEVLLGGARSTSSFDVLSTSATAWGSAIGAGADYRLRGRWSVRGHAHLLLLHSNGAWDADPRVSVGVAYRFRG